MEGKYIQILPLKNNSYLSRMAIDYLSLNSFAYGGADSDRPRSFSFIGTMASDIAFFLCVPVAM
jgi:hypothetical protein